MVAFSLIPVGRRTRFKERRGRVPFPAASESALVGVSRRNRLSPGPASGIPRTPPHLEFPGLGYAAPNSARRWRGVGGSWRKDRPPSTPPSASRARRDPAGSSPGSRVGPSSQRAALPPLCWAPQFSLFRLSPSRSPHLSLREETSPRSRAQSFLRDFPENPHELATSPLGVSFQPAPNPSLVLGARIALAQAGNPRPITDCGSGSRLVPLLRRRTGFLQGGILAPSRPLQSGLRNLR